MLPTKLVIATHSGRCVMSTKKTHFNLALMKLRDICTVAEEIRVGYTRKREATLLIYGLQK